VSMGEGSSMQCSQHEPGGTMMPCKDYDEPRGGEEGEQTVDKQKQQQARA
jgi:hypothetical protein